jgi:hypothetical protein
MFAKVQGLTVVKFPFTFLDLKEENPYTNFDNRFSLIEWYEQTENATIENSKLVFVLVEEPPIFNFNAEQIFKQTVPTFTNGNWVLGWDVVEMTELEKQNILNFQEESTPT